MQSARLWWLRTGCLVTVAACGYEPLETNGISSAIGAPILGYATPEYRPGGTAPVWDWNRCIVDPVGQVQHLKQRGDILGVTLSAGAPDPDETYDHWQGAVRLPVDTTHHFVLDIRQDSGARFEVAAIGTARAPDGRRLRGNRMSPTDQDWDVVPIPSDAVRLDQEITDNHRHPGGMQSLGSFLAVPLESSQDGSRAQFSFWDMSVLSESTTCGGACQPAELGRFDAGTEWAAVAGIAKLANGYQSDGGYLIVTASEDSEIYEFYISPPGQPLDTIPFDPHAFAKLDRATVPGFRSYYQHVSLLTECSLAEGSETMPVGKLYLLGTTSDKPGSSGDDYVDLFELDFAEQEDPNWPGSKYTVSATHVASRHLYCSSSSYERQCDFIAGAGTYIDPDGRLLIYASEHDNDGPEGSVKMMEFRSVDHLDDPTTTSVVEGCTSIQDAFVELYDDTLGSAYGPTTALPTAQGSYIDECIDVLSRSHNFETAYGFGDKGVSMRYCIPPGFSYKLFRDIDFEGDDVIVPGDWTFPVTAGVPSMGEIKGFNWSQNPGWSSGCFVRNTDPDKCLAECQ